MCTVCGAESAHVWNVLVDSLLKTEMGSTPSPWRTFPPSCVLLAPDLRGLSAALGAVVLDHIVGHPVDFGRPALSQGLVEFLPELLQRLLVCFT